MNININNDILVSKRCNIGEKRKSKGSVDNLSSALVIYKNTSTREFLK
jgi:hypothetical protein